MRQRRATWGEALMIVLALVAGIGIVHKLYVDWRPLISCSADVLDTEASMTKKECQALAAIYDANVQIEYSASRPEWKGFVPRPMRDWVGQPNPCLWNAVVCRDGHITEFSIAGNNPGFTDFLTQPRLPPEIGDLTSLHRLNIETFSVDSLPSEMSNLTNLRILSVRSDIDDGSNLAGVIGRLTNLEQLSLIGDYSPAGQDLPAALARLPKLTHLELATQGRFPPEVLEMRELTTLHLFGPRSMPFGDEEDRILTVPPAIGQLTKLTDLGFAGHSLTALPPEIAELDQLASLDLSENDFSALPPDLRRLQNLRSLNLAGNQLAEIPPEVGDLVQLQALDVSYNGLDALPPQIGTMPSLATLDLGGNDFAKLPSVVFELNPTRLGFSRNGVSEFPVQPGQLSNLTELDLSDNSLSEFPTDVGLLPNLSKLNLSSNRINDLPAEVGDLAYLSHLDLSSNFYLFDVDPLIPFVRNPGYENRLDLDSTCAFSTEPRLQTLIEDGRRWEPCPDDEASD